MEKRFDLLLKEYRLIWNNRLLIQEGIESEQVLMEVIKREIYDENSHPRIRRNKYEKFYFATQRIMASSITEESKSALIRLHIEVMEQKLY
jgi:hypothetical protein